jgi:hypothetical protein
MNHTTIGVTLVVATIAIIVVANLGAVQQQPKSRSHLQLSASNLTLAAVNQHSMQPMLKLVVGKGESHYPTPQEKITIDRTVNQTLGMLKPLGRMINESHICILEAVVCDNRNTNSATA